MPPAGQMVRTQLGHTAGSRSQVSRPTSLPPTCLHWGHNWPEGVWRGQPMSRFHWAAPTPCPQSTDGRLWPVAVSSDCHNQVLPTAWLGQQDFIVSGLEADVLDHGVAGLAPPGGSDGGSAPGEQLPSLLVGAGNPGHSWAFGHITHLCLHHRAFFLCLSIQCPVFIRTQSTELGPHPTPL